MLVHQNRCGIIFIIAAHLSVVSEKCSRGRDDQNQARDRGLAGGGCCGAIATTTKVIFLNPDSVTILAKACTPPLCLERDERRRAAAGGERGLAGVCWCLLVAAGAIDD